MPLVRDIFSPEQEPFFRFASPESQEINQRRFAEVAPKLTSPNERLKDMDSMGVDIQAISPSPAQYYYWTDGELGLQLARMQNDRVAEIVRAYPTRFVGMGTVPLQDVERATQELERIVRELGLRAVEISTNINGVDFDDPRFEQFFAKIEELDALIFMHPIGFTDAGRFREYYLTNVIGQPLESTVAVSRLIFGGVLERHPNLKLCVAHGGGYLPYYAGRMDHGYKVRPECQRLISRSPSAYLHQLYYDTVVYTGETLASLVRQVGSEHVLLGTDYPYRHGRERPGRAYCWSTVALASGQRETLGRQCGAVVEDYAVMDGPAELSPTAQIKGMSRAGLAGSSVISIPSEASASLIALAMAAGTPLMELSPVPFAPKGVKGEGVTRCAVSTWGTSPAVGRR